MKIYKETYEVFYKYLQKVFQEKYFPGDNYKEHNRNKDSPKLWEVCIDKNELPIGVVLFKKEARIFYRMMTDYKTYNVKIQDFDDSLMIQGLNFIDIHLEEDYKNTYRPTIEVEATLLYRRFFEKHYSSLLSNKEFAELFNVESNNSSGSEQQYFDWKSEKEKFKNDPQNIANVTNFIEAYYEKLSVRSGKEALSLWFPAIQRERWKDDPNKFLKSWDCYRSIRNVHVFNLKLDYTDPFTAEAMVYYETSLKVIYPDFLIDVANTLISNAGNISESLKDFLQSLSSTGYEDFKLLKLRSLFDNTLFENILEYQAENKHPWERTHDVSKEIYHVSKVDIIKCKMFFYPESLDWQVFSVKPAIINQPYIKTNDKE